MNSVSLDRQLLDAPLTESSRAHASEEGGPGFEASLLEALRVQDSEDASELSEPEPLTGLSVAPAEAEPEAEEPGLLALAPPVADASPTPAGEATEEAPGEASVPRTPNPGPGRASDLSTFSAVSAGSTLSAGSALATEPEASEAPTSFPRLEGTSPVVDRSASSAPAPVLDAADRSRPESPPPRSERSAEPAAAGVPSQRAAAAPEASAAVAALATQERGRRPAAPEPVASSQPALRAENAAVAASVPVREVARSQLRQESAPSRLGPIDSQVAEQPDPDGSAPALSVGSGESARAIVGTGSAVQSGESAQASAQPHRVEAVPHQVELLASRGGGSARLRLHPARLGEVEITVSTRGGTVDVVIRAEEPAAQAAILATRDQLAEALGSRDLRMEGFSVHADGRRGDTSGRNAFQPGSGQHERGQQDAPPQRGPAGERLARATGSFLAAHHETRTAGIDFRV